MEPTETQLIEDDNPKPVRRFIFHPPAIKQAQVEEGEDGMGTGVKTEERAKKALTILPAFYVSSIQTFETCGYFTGSFKRTYPSREKSSKLFALSDGRSVEIIPTQKYGYPNAHDLDFKRALFRLIDEHAERVERINHDGTKTYHYRVPTPLAVHTKTLIRHAGRITSARERKQLNDFLHRNTSTRLVGEIEDPKTREFTKADVALFSEVITRGEKTKEGIEAESHLIFLTPFALRCYYWHRTRQEDSSFHNQLTQAYAKVIYPYLDSGWFASFSKGGKENTKYTKAYSSVCDLLSLSKYKFESDVRRQLDPGHEELKAQGYLDNWEYYQNKDSEWIISWYPGDKWFFDMEERHKHEIPQLENKAGQGIASRSEEEARRVVNDILDVFKDKHSENFYFKVAYKLPEHEIRSAIKDVQYDTMIDPSRNTVITPAAIFTKKILAIAERLHIVL